MTGIINTAAEPDCEKESACNGGFVPDNSDADKKENVTHDVGIALKVIENGIESKEHEIDATEKADSDIRVYWYRWYVLALFSFLPALHLIGKCTWGPIETSSRAVYGWSKGTVSLLSAWSTITFIVTAIPSAYVIDVLGLRKATLFASFCMVAGSAFRCITSNTVIATYLIHCGEILIGFAGPIALCASTVISSTWFPPGQRTTATGISSLSSYAGLALSFLIGTHMVHDIDASKITKDHPEYAKELEGISLEIMHYLYMQLGICTLFFLLVIISFPSKPPKPPSITANKERVDFKSGILKLLKNPQFLLMGFAFGISNGTFSSWCVDLALNLKDFNIDNGTVGWLVFWTALSASQSGVVLGSIGDYFGKLKRIIILLFLIATVCFLTFALMCVKIVPFHTALLYATCICGGICVNGAVPMFFELAVESSYPVAEGINTVVMNIIANVFGTIFLSLPLIKGVGTAWMNWFMVATAFTCIPIMLIFRERYDRRNIDTTNTEKYENTMDNKTEMA